jgi:alpha-ribazole phosphatase
MMKLYVARHGETNLNKKKVYQGWVDSELNEEGIKHCEEIRDKLSCITFDVVITSPLKRAVQSAEIIAGTPHSKFITCDAFKELNFGLWEAMHYKEIEKNYPLEWNLWSEDWVNYTIPHGESFKIFYHRVEQGLKNMLEEYKDSTVLLVSHEGTLKVITTLLLNLGIEYYWRFNFQFGTYSEFHVTNDMAMIKKLNS